MSFRYCRYFHPAIHPISPHTHSPCPLGDFLCVWRRIHKAPHINRLSQGWGEVLLHWLSSSLSSSFPASECCVTHFSCLSSDSRLHPGFFPWACSMPQLLYTLSRLSGAFLTVCSPYSSVCDLGGRDKYSPCLFLKMNHPGEEKWDGTLKALSVALKVILIPNAYGFMFLKETSRSHGWSLWEQINDC